MIRKFELLTKIKSAFYIKTDEEKIGRNTISRKKYISFLPNTLLLKKYRSFICVA